MGGLKATFSELSWRPKSCKVCMKVTFSLANNLYIQILFHIADAPCHGKQYHNLGHDNYSNGDPSISHESMMAEIMRLDIQYWFGYINKQYTDKMIDVFNGTLSMISEQQLIIRPFNAMDPDEIGEEIQRL